MTMGKIVIVPLLISFLTCLTWSWPYGQQPVRGVNLGSWLVLEKWITPSVFNGLPDSVHDEYGLCQHLGYNEAKKRLKKHWDSWVTEGDIIKLKNSGINHLRIPIGYWAIEIPKGEPWVWGSWDYVMKAVGWAKKHGLQVMIDLHGAPGSQNGNDHSGRVGKANFYYDDKNLNLAVRVLGKMAKIFNDPEWRRTVSIIQLLNEPVLWDDYDYRLKRLKQFYRMAYDEIRKVNDIAVIAVHDAFIDHDNWYYLRDDSHYYWIMLDAHYYQVFNKDWKDYSCDQHAFLSCRYWESLPKANKKLWTIVGEWSLATPKNCKDEDGGKHIRKMATQQMAIYERASGWMFWTFKHEQGWDEWDFLASTRRGWINLHQKIEAKC